MPTISPSSLTLKHNEVRQFISSGIASPVWTLYGNGTLDQNGLYTAPGSGWGDTSFRAHTSTWSYFNPEFFQKNADDSLTKISATPGYYEQAVSEARLIAPGDSVEFICPQDNPYMVGLKNEGGTQYFSYYFNLLGIGEYHPSGNYNSGGGLSVYQGDLMRFETASGGYLRFVLNGETIYTSQNVFTGPFQFHIDATASPGTISHAPRFSGPGISNYSYAEASVFVQPDLLLPENGCELYCEAGLLTQSDGSAVNNLPDVSGRNRHLTVESGAAPAFYTGVLNGKPVVRFNNSQPLRCPEHFQFRCGWIVAKYDGAEFSNNLGLLSGYQFAAVLVSNNFGDEMFYFLDPMFEYRSKDRIYPASAAPAPMQQFAVVFFRYWSGPTWLDGVQLGADRAFPGRLWKGDVALLALYNRDFTEEEIRFYTRRVADNFALSLADVYPYQADITDTTETPVRTVNLYDPPEGNRIVEVLDDPRRLLELKFSVADQAEVRAMREFHRDHFPEQSCLYRDYRFTPPEDIEGYIDSPYELDGSINDFEYSFRFREK